ncbi:MAG: DUF1593 domain-containing protein [Draconibacterium sp.]|nr:DUF1593 domain-containing protein [Draconibacterium sp.]
MKRFLLFLLLASFLYSCKGKDKTLPKIIICTDINIDRGDPDDRQSMAHLMMYANEVEIVSIIPERWNAGGYDATMQAIDAYDKDFNNPEFNFKKLNYPDPESIRPLVQKDRENAIDNFIASARETTQPIHVLIWGNMVLVRDALRKAPDIVDKIRIYTIATHRMFQNPDAEQNSRDTTRFGIRINWNGPGRNDICNNERFNNLWWLENDWGYNGMFEGQEPRDFLLEIKEYGALGYNIWEVVQPKSWAHYFRAGDTPTLLYLLEPGVDLNNPASSTWAGKYIKPFPETRPNYWIDDAGKKEWDYANPQNSWHKGKEVYDFRVKNLMKARADMYDSYREKMKKLYNK